MSTRKFTVAAVALAATIPALAFAERLRVQDHDANVYLKNETICGAAVQIRVNSNNANAFSGHSIELQRYADVARAMIGFECGDVFEVKVEGHLNGIIEPMFSGVANASTGWLLHTNQSIAQSTAMSGADASQDLTRQSSATLETQTQMEPATYPEVTINEPQENVLQDSGYYGSTVNQEIGEPTDSVAIDQYSDDQNTQSGSYSVAGLQLGMRLDTAVRSVGEVFKESPRYDSANRLLTVEEGGCYADYDWEKRSTSPLPGWRCLRAKFDNNPTPEVQRLTLTQVAPDYKDDEAYQALIKRFGQPTIQKETKRSGDPFGIFGKPIKHLAWGDANSRNEGETKYELEATIENWRDVTILTLNLNDQTHDTPQTNNAAQVFQF